MLVRIGTCSLCGGDVMGWSGLWMSVTPPPPPKCNSCGAVTRGDVIEMVRPGFEPPRQSWEVSYGRTTFTSGDSPAFRFTCGTNLGG